VSHELLLEWVSERGSGSWELFKDAHAWLFGAAATEGDKMPPSRTMQALLMLGHLEMDWSARGWAAAPPVLTLLPSAGARALLTGSRTRALVRALEQEALDDAAIDAITARYPQEAAPDAFFIGASDERDIERLAAELGVAYEFSVSERLSQLLPSLDSYLACATEASPPRGYGIDRYNHITLRFSEAETDHEAGLYRYDVYGRPQFRLRSSEELRAVDMSIGIYAELRQRGTNCLEYDRAEINGTLSVPVNAPLPVLHSRAAALCSGLMPSLDRSRWRLRYMNVPRPVAQRIARTLDQQLQLPVPSKESQR
jgi:hypothetical protein